MLAHQLLGMRKTTCFQQKPRDLAGSGNSPLRNDKVTGAKMRPAIASWIVTADTPVSCWSMFILLSLVTAPEVFAKVD